MALAGCALIVAGGMALAAVQLLSGMDFVSESVRSTGTKYEFSETFSFPPENVLTMVAPEVFGPLVAPDGAAPPDAYFGRCYLWEVSLFVSVAGLIFAIYGACASAGRYRRGAITMVIVCFILALGAHTPLHHFLYDHLPGFSSFRGAVKFNYLVALFLSLLAACGFDQLLRTRRASIGLLAISVALLAIVLTVAVTIQSTAGDGLKGAWGRCISSAIEAGADQSGTSNLGDILANTAWLGDPRLIAQAGQTAAHGLFFGAGVLVLIIVLLGLTWVRPNFAYALIGLAILEMTCFAISTRATMSADVDISPAEAAAIKQTANDARVLDVNTTHDNFAMWLGYDAVWGYDPGVLKRYAELVAQSQGINPDNASQYLQFHVPDRTVLPLLRVATIFTNEQKQPVLTTNNAMSVAQLVPSATVRSGRDDVLARVESADFDPRHEVVLESEPSIKPADSLNSGTVETLNETTDSIELTADVHANSILLITNAYSHGWRTEPIGPNPQDHYEVLPADWAFQAIPLLTGQHHLRLEYHPAAFVAGKWISILALLSYIGAGVWYFRRDGFGHAPADRSDG